MRICRLRSARGQSPFKGFSSRNRREVPRRAPHRRHSAHRRPPIAPTLPPPGRQVARGAGAAGSLQPFVEILPNDFAVPSICIPQSDNARLAVRRIPAICNPRPPILSVRRIATQFASPGWCHCTAASGSPPPLCGDIPREYTLRHVPPFAVCEDATVRDDWICRTKQSVLPQESAQADGARPPI
jgi:hypothetical protein